MKKKPKKVNLNKEVYVLTNKEGFITDILCDYCAEENPYFQEKIKNCNLTVTKRLLTQKEKDRIMRPFVGCMVGVCGY